MVKIHTSQINDYSHHTKKTQPRHTKNFNLSHQKHSSSPTEESQLCQIEQIFASTRISLRTSKNEVHPTSEDIPSLLDQKYAQDNHDM